MKFLTAGTKRRPSVAVRTATTGRCLVMLAVLAIAGCGDDPTPAPAPATQPATRPAPRPATLTVGGEPVTFAQPALDVTADAGSLQVTLTGGDGSASPRQSFYFTAAVEGARPEDLVGQVWRFKRAEGEEVDAAAGVFMEGNSLRFLPVELQIEFAGRWPEVVVTMQGKLLRDGDESKPVSLKGTYTVWGN